MLRAIGVAPETGLVWTPEIWEKELTERRVLPLRLDSPVTIKRDVRSFVVSASAAEFAEAFARSMADPNRAFGLVRVMRPRADVGRPFEVGQRFQGRFSVRQLLVQQAEDGRLDADWLERMTNWSRSSSMGRLLQGALRSVEDAWTSDFGELVELDTNHFPARVKYVYLEGSYIAGSSAFEVEELGPGRCRVEQTWVYQENPSAVRDVGGNQRASHALAGRVEPGRASGSGRRSSDLGVRRS